jgi:hypothetical protein
VRRSPSTQLMGLQTGFRLLFGVQSEKLRGIDPDFGDLC